MYVCIYLTRVRATGELKGARPEGGKGSEPRGGERHDNEPGRRDFISRRLHSRGKPPLIKIWEGGGREGGREGGGGKKG